MAANSNIFSDEILPPVRSSFLTVLCILTFIGSAFGIYQGVNNITQSGKLNAAMKQATNKNKQAEQRKKLEEKKDTESKFALKMMDSVKVMADEGKLKQSGIFAIISNLLTIFGAILMWRMQPKGFYAYTAGIIIWILSPIIIYGTGAFIAMIGAAFAFFVGLLFVILYAMNLKDMKKPVAQ